MQAEQTVSTVRVFNPQQYTNIMVSGLGVSLSEVPAEVIAEAHKATAQGPINQLLMACYKQRTVEVAPTYSAEDKAYFKTLVSNEHSSRANDINRNINGNIASAISKFAQGQSYMLSRKPSPK